MLTIVIAIHNRLKFTSLRNLTSLLDEMVLLMYVNWSINFRGLLLKIEIDPLSGHGHFSFKTYELGIICVRVEGNAPGWF